MLKIKPKSIYIYIYAISLIGFFMLAIFGPPYGEGGRYHWDSNHVFNKYVIEGNPPTNWMGWFYVYFWGILYKFTNAKSSIGIFHNILYWGSMPIIYINFFDHISNKKQGNYILWYIIFAFCPYIMSDRLPNISNNILTMSFILFSVAIYTIYLQTRHKRYICLSFMVLLCASFLRRDSFIIVLPIVGYFGFILMNRNIIKGILIAILFISVQFTIDNSVTKKYPLYDKPQYPYAIDTLSLTMFYDLTIMSYLKNELLIPDSILKPEYQTTNNIEVLTKIRSINFKVISYEWLDVQSLGSFLESGTVWFSGLTIKETLPIYISNIHWYIVMRGIIFLAYIVNYLSLIVGSFVSVWVLFKKRELFSQEKFEFLLVLIIASWLFSIVVCLSAVSVQLRYLVIPVVLLWFSCVYVGSRVFQISSNLDKLSK